MLRRQGGGKIPPCRRLSGPPEHMLSYLIRRALLVIPTLVVISMIAFAVIDLPPGDYVDTYVQQVLEMGGDINQGVIQSLRELYGFDRPLHVRYLKWIGRFLQGDFGYSLYFRAPVLEIIGSRFLLSMIVSIASILFGWIIAFPIGIYSATHQYSWQDFFWTLVGFLGLSIPNFLLGLILMFLGYRWFGLSIGGLFSTELQDAAWSLAKVGDLLSHLWIPVVVIGTSGTAGLIRVVRANLMDELNKPYVEMARARGLGEFRLLLKYPVRIAINPFLSSIGWVLPAMISGEAITSVVLGLPTAGPVFLQALRSQDMQLAGAYIMLISLFTIAGILLSDVLLAAVDPRIKYG